MYATLYLQSDPDPKKFGKIGKIGKIGCTPASCSTAPCSTASTCYLVTQAAQLYTMPFHDSGEGRATALLREAEAKFIDAPSGTCVATGDAATLTVFTGQIQNGDLRQKYAV